MATKAYENMDFIHSADARIIRVMAEFFEPQRRLKRHHIQDTVVFFGSARSYSSQTAKNKLRDLEQQWQGKSITPEAQILINRAKKKIRLCEYHDDAVELARLMTTWSMGLKNRSKRFIICSGGGPGMMEAANQGAHEAGGLSVGFTISMPNHFEPANAYISDDLCFEFHYFFMRKYWFAYLAKALVIFPGGFGTLDELMEVLTLVQTKKIKKEIPIVIYGSEYWNDVLHLDRLVEWGTINADDMKLFKFCDTPASAHRYLTEELTRIHNL